MYAKLYFFNATLADPDSIDGNFSSDGSEDDPETTKSSWEEEMSCNLFLFFFLFENKCWGLGKL